MHATRANYLAILWVALLWPPLAQAKSTHDGKYSADSLTKTLPLASGQSVWLDVNVADIHILPNLDDRHLQLVIQPNHEITVEEMQSWIRQFDVNGNQANIRLHMPKQGNESGKVTLYVPASTALNVDLDIGDLTIDSIGGNKDLNVNVGRLKLGGLNPGASAL